MTLFVLNLSFHKKMIFISKIPLNLFFLMDKIQKIVLDQIFRFPNNYFDTIKLNYMHYIIHFLSDVFSNLLKIYSLKKINY